MTDQQTNVANSAETTLSSALASGATTINVVDGTSFPAIPFYIVLDPGKDATREVALVDSAKTATTFTLTSSASRGLDGTTDANHDSGATVAMVPVAAHWTDINDRVDAGDVATALVQTNLDTHTAATNPHSGSASNTDLSTHTGASNPHSGSASSADLTAHTGATPAHSATSSATPDRIVLRDASGRAMFGDPSVATEAATKGYVDGLSPFAPTYAAISRSTTQAIASGTTTQVDFTTTDAESTATFGDTTNDRLVIPADGFYEVIANLTYENNATGKRQLLVYVNGALYEGDVKNSTGTTRCNISVTLPTATSGDLITVHTIQDSGASLNVTGARLSAHRVA